MPHDFTASILFVDEHGSLLEKARLLRILLNEKPSPLVYEKLLSLQNPDGGFPSRPRGGSPSSVDSTLTALWQLDELGMFETPQARRGLDFLVSMQRAYGGWDENPNLPVHDLPPWIRPGETATRLYLSTYAAYWLGLAGKDYQPVLQTSAAFLAAWQGTAGKPGAAAGPAKPAGIANRSTTSQAARNTKPAGSGEAAGSEEPAGSASPELPAPGHPGGPIKPPVNGQAAEVQPEAAAPGQIPGYLHNNWLGTSAFLMAGPSYAQNARLGLDFLMSRSASAWEDSQIAWAIDCLVRAGLPAQNPFIQFGIDLLQQRRAPDGSWSSEDGPAFAASATVGAIKVLTRLGK